MQKTEQMLNMLKQNNGYLFSAEVKEAGISRTHLANFVKNNNLEKVAKGIYVSEDTWPDDLYILQKCYPDIIYASETALYLHQMIDREYSDIYVSVPPKFSGTRLRERGINIHQEKADTYELGLTIINTNYGNSVRTYDKERLICDLLKKRGDIEVQNFQAAILGYMNGKQKDLSKLMIYAEKLNVRDEVMKYVEVLV